MPKRNQVVLKQKDKNRITGKLVQYAFRTALIEKCETPEELEKALQDLRSFPEEDDVIEMNKIAKAIKEKPMLMRTFCLGIRDESVAQIEAQIRFVGAAKKIKKLLP